MYVRSLPFFYATINQDVSFIFMYRAKVLTNRKYSSYYRNAGKKCTIHVRYRYVALGSKSSAELLSHIEDYFSSSFFVIDRENKQTPRVAPMHPLLLVASYFFSYSWMSRRADGPTEGNAFLCLITGVRIIDFSRKCDISHSGQIWSGPKYFGRVLAKKNEM